VIYLLSTGDKAVLRFDVFSIFVKSNRLIRSCVFFKAPL